MASLGARSPRWAGSEKDKNGEKRIFDYAPSPSRPLAPRVSDGEVFTEFSVRQNPSSHTTPPKPLPGSGTSPSPPNSKQTGNDITDGSTWKRTQLDK